MIAIFCATCGNPMQVHDQYAGTTGKCGKCGGLVVIPALSEARGITFCPQCGQKNDLQSAACVKCGCSLQNRPSTLSSTDANDESLQRIVPYKNRNALAAYYLGIFALVPFLGIPLIPVAIGLGIKGYLNGNRNPVIRGKIHAVVGILLGVFAILENVALVSVLKTLM